MQRFVFLWRGVFSLLRGRKSIKAASGSKIMAQKATCDSSILPAHSQLLEALQPANACTAFLHELVGRLKQRHVLSAKNNVLSLADCRQKKRKTLKSQVDFDSPAALHGILGVPYCAPLLKTHHFATLAPHTHTFF